MRKLMMLVSVLFVITASGELIADPQQNDSWTACADTLKAAGWGILTPAQADSLVKVLDDMELQIRLLEADLQEARAERPNSGAWLVRTAKHPALWFCVGLTAGFLVAR